MKTCPFKIISLAKSINYVFHLLHVVGGVGRAGLMKNAIELHYVVCIKCVWCVDPRKSSPLLWWILIKNKQTNYEDCSIQFILRYLHTHTFYSEAPQTVWDCNSKLLGRSSHCKYPGVHGGRCIKTPFVIALQSSNSSSVGISLSTNMDIPCVDILLLNMNTIPLLHKYITALWWFD